MHHNPLTRSASGAAVLVLAFVGGCSLLNWNSSDNVDLADSTENAATHPDGAQSGAIDQAQQLGPSSKTGKNFRWDGGGVVLGEADHLAFADHEFQQSVADLIEQRRFRSAQTLVLRYPDMALTALSGDPNAAQADVALGVIADVFDSHWATTDSRLCRDYHAWTGPDRERWLQGHSKFVAYLEQDQPEQALALQLDKLLPKNPLPFVDIECRRLQSIAHLTSRRSDVAIQQLNQAVAIADRSSMYLASQLRLLLGEFYRHSGNLEMWRQTWAQAVSDHAQLLGDDHLLDPVFWTRAAYLHPSNAAWPQEILAQQVDFLVNQGFLPDSETISGESTEAVVWLTVGAMHLNRDEGQNALLALKKSEALFTKLELQTELRLHEARAMIATGQPGAASAILIRLISEASDATLQDRAKAVLGAIKLQNGAVAQGLNLLKTALASSATWPPRDRLRAQADYSLGLLIRGREDEGIPLLDQVQQEFEACQEPEQAYQCLWNKAKFYEKTSQDAKRLAVADRLQDFETQAMVR